MCMNFYVIQGQQMLGEAKDDCEQLESGLSNEVYKLHVT